MGEADAAVELGVAGEAFLDARHSDENDAHVVAVDVVRCDAVASCNAIAG